MTPPILLRRHCFAFFYHVATSIHHADDITLPDDYIRDIFAADAACLPPLLPSLTRSTPDCLIAAMPPSRLLISIDAFSFSPRLLRHDATPAA